MYLSIAPGLLGISIPFPEAIELAAHHGFAGVDADASALTLLSPAEVASARDQMAQFGVCAGYFSVGMVISAPEDVWQKGVETLRQCAPVAQQLGYTRATAVVLPFSETLAYEQNFQFHLDRMGQILPLLAENGISLGLEYVAPLTRRAPYQLHFLHDLRGALELIEAASAPNLGLLLDSFHWFCAREAPEAIAALPAGRIVAVHLNDAIKDRPLEQQMAMERVLPLESGEIDLRGFLQAIQKTGYDGPLTCEPMNKQLNALGAEKAAAKTFEAMRKTLDLA